MLSTLCACLLLVALCTHEPRETYQPTRRQLRAWRRERLRLP
jgi:hypothetical protein